MAPPQVDAEYQKEIEKARRDLSELISRENCAPQMLHLALHDAGTYDPKSKTTVGPNGSTRMEPDKDIDEGLKKARDLCENLKKNYKKITHADLYQLAGVVAVVVTQGPEIVFNPGRMDSTIYQEVERLIPQSKIKIDAQQLRNILIHIGVNTREFVALYGGLYGLVSQAQAQPQPKGTDGLKFDNSYFSCLVDEKNRTAAAVAQKTPQEDAKTTPSETKPQEDAKTTPSDTTPREDPKTTPSSDVLKHCPVANALMTDQNFFEIVELYEKNKDRFLADYVAAHKKVSELGFTPSALAGSPWNTVRLAQGAIGIAIATTVVILGYFLSRRGK